MRRSSLPLVALVLAGSLVGLAACLDVNSPAGTVTSIVLALPAPSVIAGEDSRDSTGARAPFRVIALGPYGDTLRDSKATFFVLDSVASDTARVLSIDASGYAHGFKAGLARIVGSVGALQTPPAQVTVTIRPAKMTVTHDSVRAPAGTDTLPMATVTAKLVGAGADSTRGAAGFIVDFTVVYSPASRSSARTVVVVNESRRETTRDTTDASGTASRSVGLNIRNVADPNLLLGAKRDSIVVEVRAQPRGATVSGTPVRVTVPVSLK